MDAKKIKYLFNIALMELHYLGYFYINNIGVDKFGEIYEPRQIKNINKC